MDDIKVFLKNQEVMVQTVKIFSQDIELKFALEKKPKEL